MDASSSIGFLGASALDDAAEDTLTNFSAQYSEAPGPLSDSLLETVASSIQPPRPIIRLQDHLTIPPVPSVQIVSSSKSVSFKPLATAASEPASSLPAGIPRQVAIPEADGPVHDTPLMFSRTSSCDSLQSFQVPSQIASSVPSVYSHSRTVSELPSPGDLPGSPGESPECLSPVPRARTPPPPAACEPSSLWPPAEPLLPPAPPDLSLLIARRVEMVRAADYDEPRSSGDSEAVRVYDLEGTPSCQSELSHSASLSALTVDSSSVSASSSPPPVPLPLPAGPPLIRAHLPPVSSFEEGASGSGSGSSRVPGYLSSSSPFSSPLLSMPPLAVSTHPIPVAVGAVGMGMGMGVGVGVGVGAVGGGPGVGVGVGAGAGVGCEGVFLSAMLPRPALHLAPAASIATALRPDLSLNQLLSNALALCNQRDRCNPSHDELLADCEAPRVFATEDTPLRYSNCTPMSSLSELELNRPPAASDTAAALSPAAEPRAAAHGDGDCEPQPLALEAGAPQPSCSEADSDSDSDSDSSANRALLSQLIERGMPKRRSPPLSPTRATAHSPPLPPPPLPPAAVSAASPPSLVDAPTSTSATSAPLYSSAQAATTQSSAHTNASIPVGQETGGCEPQASMSGPGPGRCRGPIHPARSPDIETETVKVCAPAVPTSAPQPPLPSPPAFAAAAGAPVSCSPPNAPPSTESRGVASHSRSPPAAAGNEAATSGLPVASALSPASRSHAHTQTQAQTQRAFALVPHQRPGPAASASTPVCAATVCPSLPAGMAASRGHMSGPAPVLVPGPTATGTDMNGRGGSRSGGSAPTTEPSEHSIGLLAIEQLMSSMGLADVAPQLRGSAAHGHGHERAHAHRKFDSELGSGSAVSALSGHSTATLTEQQSCPGSSTLIGSRDDYLEPIRAHPQLQLLRPVPAPMPVLSAPLTQPLPLPAAHTRGALASTTAPGVGPGLGPGALPFSVNVFEAPAVSLSTLPPLPAAAAAAAADENGKNKSSKKKKKKAHPTTRNEELPVGAWLPPTQQALALVNTQAHMHSSLRRSSSLRITQTPQSQLLFGAATGAGAGAVAGAACTSSSSAQSQSQAANSNVAGVYYPSTYRDRFVADDKLTPERGDREREKPPSRWTQVLDALLHRSPSKHAADKDKRRRRAQLRPSASAEALHNVRLYPDAKPPPTPGADFESLARPSGVFGVPLSSARATADTGARAPSRDILRWASPQPHEPHAAAHSSSPAAAPVTCSMPRSAPASPSLSRQRSVRMRTPIGVQIEQQLLESAVRDAVERELVRETPVQQQQQQQAARARHISVGDNRQWFLQQQQPAHHAAQLSPRALFPQDRSFQIFSFDDALDSPLEAPTLRPVPGIGPGHSTLPHEAHSEARERSTRSSGGALKKLAALFAGFRRSTSKSSRSRAARDATPASYAYPMPSPALPPATHRPLPLPVSLTFGCDEDLTRRSSNPAIRVPRHLPEHLDTSSLTSASINESSADYSSGAEASKSMAQAQAQGAIWVRRDVPSAPPIAPLAAASRQIPTSADLPARRTNSLVSTAV